MSRAPNLNHILKSANAAANRGRKILLNYFGDLKQVREKQAAGLVSEADLESERVITKLLLDRHPNTTVLGEEASYKKPARGRARPPVSDGRWIVDPLDGTTNYVHGFHVFCISIGFEWRGQLQVGVVDVPLLNVRYTAVKGHGAFRNRQRLSVSKRRPLKNCLLATGFFPDNKPAFSEQLAIFASLINEVRGIRRAGSAAYDLCLVAEGVFDAFWERNLQPWDTAAGVLIVREAGGVVLNYDGQPYSVENDSLIASNKKIVAPLLKKIDEGRNQI